ncbi:MAG: ComF family protein [Candidatus Dormibacteraceae bacterium]
MLPPRCGGCRTLGGWLCQLCAEQIHPLRQPFCRRCGRELEFVNQPCSCRHHLRSLSRLRSAALYQGSLERAIHRFKYEGWRSLAPVLAGLLTEQLTEQVDPGTAILSVPLHRRRQRQRGYNQAQLLADELGCRLHLKAVKGRLLRLRDTPAQVGLDRLARRSNVSGAFEWHGTLLQNQSLLLIDDVATTGATLEACAGVLRAAGAGKIIGWTLARVQL